MRRIIKITESQLDNIIKKNINENHLNWYDPEVNKSFENITDEKIIKIFEKYGLCADKHVCHMCKIDYHPQGDIMVFYDSYAIDGDFPDNIHSILEKISNELGAEQTIILEPGVVKFLFYNKVKSIE